MGLYTPKFMLAVPAGSSKVSNPFIYFMFREVVSPLKDSENVLM